REASRFGGAIEQRLWGDDQCRGGSESDGGAVRRCVRRTPSKTARHVRRRDAVLPVGRRSRGGAGGAGGGGASARQCPCPAGSAGGGSPLRGASTHPDRTRARHLGEGRHRSREALRGGEESL